MLTLAQRLALHDREAINRIYDISFEELPADARRIFAAEGITGNELVVHGRRNPGHLVETPLWIACMSMVGGAPLDVVTMFPALQINAKDSDGNNALSCGCLTLEKLAYLKGNGIDVRHKNDHGVNCLTSFWSVRQHFIRREVRQHFIRREPWPVVELRLAYQLMDLGVALEHDECLQKPPDVLIHYAQRSAQRRAHCKRVCIALLGSVWPRDLARMLARAVWATRLNRECWEPREPPLE